MDTIFLTTQYNGQVREYVKLFAQYNTESDSKYFSHLLIDYKSLQVLDMGCGDGTVLQELSSRGADVCGVDSSSEMILQAKHKVPLGDIRHESFVHTSFKKEQFDWVISKWALQTHTSILEIYTEVNRLLKPGGIFLFLVTHPLRQFVEQREKRDYYSKQLVESRFFDGHIIVHEPQHTLSDYFSNFFLSHFQVLAFEEGVDCGAEVIDGAIYPSFFLVKARKNA